MPEEYEEYENQPAEEVGDVAPAPFTPPTQWSWSPRMLLWVAGAVLALGFGTYFLMSYSGARARAIAALQGGSDDNSSD
jgi:uncharacterized membrane protein